MNLRTPYFYPKLTIQDNIFATGVEPKWCRAVYARGKLFPPAKHREVKAREPRALTPKVNLSTLTTWSTFWRIRMINLTLKRPLEGTARYRGLPVAFLLAHLHRLTRAWQPPLQAQAPRSPLPTNPESQSLNHLMISLPGLRVLYDRKVPETYSGACLMYLRDRSKAILIE